MSVTLCGIVQCPSVFGEAEVPFLGGRVGDALRGPVVG